MSLLETIRQADANTVGELLRDWTFPENDREQGLLGCRSTFVVREDAVHWQPDAVQAFYAIYLDEEQGREMSQVRPRRDDTMGHCLSFAHQGLRVDCCWFWDGDGVLCYGVWDGDELIRALENWDCKKDYVWRDGQAAEASSTLYQAFGGLAHYLGLDQPEHCLVQLASDERLEPARRFGDQLRAQAWAQAQIEAGQDWAQVYRVAAEQAPVLVHGYEHPALTVQSAYPRARLSPLGDGGFDL